MILAHGALQALLAVLAGAFGAHGLKATLSPYHFELWQTAAHYHLIHALAIVAVAALAGPRYGTLKPAHYCFSLGLYLFSGSLYALALTDLKILGAITPLGGLAFMLGWGLLAVQGWRNRGGKSPAV